MRLDVGFQPLSLGADVTECRAAFHNLGTSSTLHGNDPQERGCQETEDTFTTQQGTAHSGPSKYAKTMNHALIEIKIFMRHV
ncbi:hypothetical protein PDJAM_G00082040 [Pangasius djambal]|uniref:Uncharacterized protein n=1 Tax=Pangasius djambal TaxID=1691987 RepID=A0ACC5Z2S6_9TELE|nr:hypothetical protein [Pangasius djambal]